MLTITDLAAEKAMEILKAEEKEGWGIRVFFAGSSCCGPSFSMDIEEAPTGNDKVIENSGLKVFADKGISDKLEGMVIDYIVDNEQGEGFVMKSPQTHGGGSSCSSGGCSSCG